MVKRPRKPVRVLAVCPADDNNVVKTIEGGGAVFRRTPCPGCPWVVKNTGSFPAEAFRLSAGTSYDMADHSFGCHERGSEKPTTCAGFLLRNAAHNLSVRLSVALHGWALRTLRQGRRKLHASYRAMAIANGVDPNDPVLARCRAND